MNNVTLLCILPPQEVTPEEEGFVDGSFNEEEWNGLNQWKCCCIPKWVFKGKSILPLTKKKVFSGNSFVRAVNRSILKLIF